MFLVLADDAATIVLIYPIGEFTEVRLTALFSCFDVALAGFPKPNITTADTPSWRNMSVSDDAEQLHADAIAYGFQ